ncbi:MAG: NAD-dependent epimerase/dehydratase family protein [Flavisolibacter sp.]
MRKILITGAAGFIPSSLADRLIADGNSYVVGIDNFLTGKSHNLPSGNPDNYKFIKADVNNYEDISAIMLAYRFDYIFHYAAVVGVKRTLENPLMVLDDIKGIQNVLHLAKNTGVKRVFFSSSSEVYGEPVEFPQNEFTTPLNSKLPYAIVKNVGEAFLKSYQLEHNLDYTIFRFFNTYGPKQSTDFVLSKFLRAALADKEITLYGDGLQTRTFCYIDDNIETTIKCLNNHLYINDVVNIGSSKEITIKELAETVIRMTGSSSRITHLPPLKEGDMRRRCPDNDKMKAVLKRELLSLEDGVQRIMEHLKKKLTVDN